MSLPIPSHPSPEGEVVSKHDDADSCTGLAILQPRAGRRITSLSACRTPPRCVNSEANLIRGRSHLNAYQLTAIPIACSYESENVFIAGTLYRLPPQTDTSTPPLIDVRPATPTKSSSDTSRTSATANASTSPRLLVFRDEPLASGGTSSVHELKHDPDVLMKISVWEDDLPAAEHEGRLYQRFGKELTGIVPEFYGMFSGRPLRTDSIILLLARHGRPVRVWGDLTKVQRYVFRLASVRSSFPRFEFCLPASLALCHGAACSYTFALQ